MMMLCSQDSVILFGSAARGDQGASSDIDILVVGDFSFPKTSKNDNIEVQYTPRNMMFAKARDGDLFAIHIAFEGRVISDPSGFMREFRESIAVQKDYSVIREQAEMLLAYLVACDGGLDLGLSQKRTAWAVRTILISLLVEQGKFIFSPKGIAAAFDFQDLPYLIELRRGEHSWIKSKKIIADFLSWRGRDSLSKIKPSEMLRIMKGFGPSVALSTAMKITEGNEVSSDNYF